MATRLPDSLLSPRAGAGDGLLPLIWNELAVFAGRLCYAAHAERVLLGQRHSVQARSLARLVE